MSGRSAGASFAGQWLLVATIASILCAVPASAKSLFGGKKASAASALLVGPAGGQTADGVPAEGLMMQRRGFGVIVHPALEQQLNGILQDLQRALSTAPPRAHVYAMPDTDFRAYSTGDGGIFIAMGMLQSMESRDEVAALVAHEYAHIVLRHHEKSRFSAVAEKAYGLGSLYLSLRYGSSGSLTSDLTRKFVVNELALEGVQSAMMPAMDRGQENDADRLAADLIVRAGYNPVGLVTFMDRMVEWEKRNAQSAQQREVRVKETARWIETSGNSVQLNLDAKLDGLVARVGAATTDGVSLLRRRHHPASKRAESMREYLSTAHADADRPDERPVPWANAKDVKQLFAGVSAAHSTAAALGANNGRLALEWAAKASSSPAVRSPYVRLVTTQAQGKDPQGKTLATLEREMESPDSVFMLHYLVLDVVERTDPKRAMAVLERSRRVLADPPELLPYSIRMNKQAGNTPAMTLYVAKCTALGNRGLTQACQSEQ